LDIPVISPLLVSMGSLGAAIAILTLPMRGYIKNSLSIWLAWFGACYWVIYWLTLDLDAVSFIARFNLLLFFAIIIICAIAWHWHATIVPAFKRLWGRIRGRLWKKSR
jgi:hypothetical protein